MIWSVSTIFVTKFVYARLDPQFSRQASGLSDIASVEMPVITEAGYIFLTPEYVFGIRLF